MHNIFLESEITCEMENMVKCFAKYYINVIFLGANKDIRDWSGKKPHQYLNKQSSTTQKENYRREYRAIKRDHMVVINSKHAKHQSFLRKSFTPTQRRNKALTYTSNH